MNQSLCPVSSTWMIIRQTNTCHPQKFKGSLMAETVGAYVKHLPRSGKDFHSTRVKNKVVVCLSTHLKNMWTSKWVNLYQTGMFTSAIWNHHSFNHLVHQVVKFYIYGCFRKTWYPQIIHFNRVFHYKSWTLGYPYFWKPPYSFVVSPDLSHHLPNHPYHTPPQKAGGTILVISTKRDDEAQGIAHSNSLSQPSRHNGVYP